MSEIPFYKKEKFIHIAVEVVIIGGVIYYFKKQIDNLNETINHFHQLIHEKEKKIKELENIIRTGLTPPLTSQFSHNIPPQIPSHIPSHIPSNIPSHIHSHIPSNIPSHIVSQLNQSIPVQLPFNSKNFLEDPLNLQEQLKIRRQKMENNQENNKKNNQKDNKENNVIVNNTNPEIIQLSPSKPPLTKKQVDKELEEELKELGTNTKKKN